MSRWLAFFLLVLSSHAVGCADDLAENLFLFEGEISPVVRVSMNGGPPRAFLLDTGAQANFVDPDHPDISGSAVESISIGVVDLGRQFTETSVELEFNIRGDVIWGVLGAPTFEDSVLMMDYETHTAGLFGSEQEARSYKEASLLQELQTVSARRENGWILIPVQVNGAEFEMMVDTAGNTQIRSDVVGDTFAGTPQLSDIPVFNAQAGTTFVSAATACDFSVGADSEPEGVTIGDGIPIPAILGFGWLRDRFVLFDYVEDRLIFARYATPIPRPVGWSPFFSEKRSEGHVIWYVFPGSDAEAAGIQVGDRLVAVDGQPIDPMGAEEDVRELLTGDVGLMVSVVVSRDGSEQTISFVRENPLADACEN